MLGADGNLGFLFILFIASTITSQTAIAALFTSNSSYLTDNAPRFGGNGTWTTGQIPEGAGFPIRPPENLVEGFCVARNSFLQYTTDNADIGNSNGQVFWTATRDFIADGSSHALHTHLQMRVELVESMGSTLDFYFSSQTKNRLSGRATSIHNLFPGIPGVVTLSSSLASIDLSLTNSTSPFSLTIGTDELYQSALFVFVPKLAGQVVKVTIFSGIESRLVAEQSSAVPEPMSLTLFGMGILSAPFMMDRRKRSSPRCIIRSCYEKTDS